MRIPSGTTDQVVYFVALDSTDLKTRETGLSSFTVYRSRNGGTATVFTTPTVAELSAANMPGVYSLLLDEDMTIDSGDDSQEMLFHITHAGMAPVDRSIELYRRSVTGGQTIAVGGSIAQANVTQISGDATAADNLESAFDGTGYKSALSVKDIQQGYDNVLHAGSGQPYATIEAGTDAATAGDLVIAHRGTYNEANPWKEGVDVYLAAGAILNNQQDDISIIDQASDSTLKKFKIFGPGWLIATPPTSEIPAINLTVADTYIDIDVGRFEAVGQSTMAVSVGGSATGRLSLKADSIKTQANAVLQTNSEAFTTEIESHQIDTESFGSLSNALAIVSVKSDKIKLGSTNTLTGSAGLLLVDGNLNYTHASANGLQGVSGITVVALSGSVTVPMLSGRPSLSGSGLLKISNAFAYNTATSTASNVEPTTSGKIDAYIPDAAPGTNGGLPTVNASNYIAGLAGTINTLDALDTAQDTQHATTQTATTTISNKLGAITGSGLNTVLGFFRALMAKAASLTGTDISTGTTYDNTTDALEANRDNIGTAGAGLTAVVADAPTEAEIFSYFEANSTPFGDEMDAQGYTTAVATQIETNLDAKVSEVEGGSGQPTSAAFVDDEHTWWFQYSSDLTAANTIYEMIGTGTSIGFNGLLQMDFTKPLPEGSSINQILNVDIQPTGLNVTSQLPSSDHLKAIIGISTTGTALPEAGVYNVAITVETEDSQEITRQARLILRMVGA